MKTVSFIIPVFRNQESLNQLYETISAEVKSYSKNLNYRFLFVDDGSDDSSLGLIKELNATQSNVDFIRLSRNFGQVSALEAGIDHSKSDVVILMGADLQEPINLIPKMLDEWLKSYKIVVGYRQARNDSAFASFSSSIFYYLMRLSIPNMPKGGFDFVLLDKKAYKLLSSIKNRNKFLQGDILWMGFPISFLPYERKKRIHGKSQFNLAKKTKYFYDGLINTSNLPIKFVSFIGFLTFISGILYSIIIIFLYLFNNTPFEGWAPLMITILLIGGFILLTLGVLGEYIWRIHDELKQKPNYVIEETNLND